MTDVTIPLLRSLIERARALLGDDFKRLYAKHNRGTLRNPHRLIVLVQRVEQMIGALECGERVLIDSVAIEPQNSLYQRRAWSSIRSRAPRHARL